MNYLCQPCIPSTAGMASISLDTNMPIAANTRDIVGGIPVITFKKQAHFHFSNAKKKNQTKKKEKKMKFWNDDHLNLPVELLLPSQEPLQRRPMALPSSRLHERAGVEPVLDRQRRPRTPTRRQRAKNAVRVIHCLYIFPKTKRKKKGSIFWGKKTKT